MRPEISEFSPGRDRALGAALRAALDRPYDGAFLVAVLERARLAGVGSSRAVLGRPPWTRAAVAAAVLAALVGGILVGTADRKSTRLNSSHDQISYAVFCLKKKKNQSQDIPDRSTEARAH